MDGFSAYDAKASATSAKRKNVAGKAVVGVGYALNVKSEGDNGLKVKVCL
jgi:hypothetical protein